MRILTVLIFIAIILQSCGNKKNDNCNDDLCKKKMTIGQAASVISDTTKSLSCKLTSAELQDRKATVLSVLKKNILEKKELKDGYSFKFENSDEMINMLTDFIKSERKCCDFFNFTMSVKNNGFIWFDLTGPKDAKEMIGEELGL